MTGILVRVLREGRGTNAELDQLSDEELDRFLEQKGWIGDSPAVEPGQWVKTLAQWIRDNVIEPAEKEVI